MCVRACVCVFVSACVHVFVSACVTSEDQLLRGVWSVTEGSLEPLLKNSMTM